MHPHAVAQPAPLDLGLELGRGGRPRRPRRAPRPALLEHVEQRLDPLVALQPAEVEQRRLGGAPPRLERPDLHADVVHVDRGRARRRARRCRAPCVRDRLEARARVEPAQRRGLEQERRELPLPAHLRLVVVAVHVVDEHHARHAQPQRREEGDPVDHLEHHVGVGHEPAPLLPDHAREDGRAPAHPVHRQVADPLHGLARPGSEHAMTETRWPHASQRETWPNRFVPVPPPCGWVQSRSVSTRMCIESEARSGRGLARTKRTADAL